MRMRPTLAGWSCVRAVVATGDLQAVGPNHDGFPHESSTRIGLLAG